MVAAARCGRRRMVGVQVLARPATTQGSKVSAPHPVPAVDSAKFTPRGDAAERSAFLTGDGAYSYGEFAGGR